MWCVCACVCMCVCACVCMYVCVCVCVCVCERGGGGAETDGERGCSLERERERGRELTLFYECSGVDTESSILRGQWSTHRVFLHQALAHEGVLLLILHNYTHVFHIPPNRTGY